MEKYPVVAESNDKDCKTSRKFYGAEAAPRRQRTEVLNTDPGFKELPGSHTDR